MVWKVHSITSSLNATFHLQASLVEEVDPNLHCHFYFEKYSCNMTASSPRLQMICIYHSLLLISSNFYCEDCWMENMLFSMLGYFCFLYNFEIHVKSWVLIKSRKWALHIFQDILPCHAVAMGKINWASIFLNAYPRLMERSRYSLGWLYICFQKTVQSVCAYWMHKNFANMSTDNIPMTMIDFS